MFTILQSNANLASESSFTCSSVSVFFFIFRFLFLGSQATPIHHEPVLTKVTLFFYRHEVPPRLVNQSRMDWLGGGRRLSSLRAIGPENFINEIVIVRI